MKYPDLYNDNEVAVWIAESGIQIDVDDAYNGASSTLTPAKAREIAAALIRAADMDEMKETK